MNKRHLHPVPNLIDSDRINDNIEMNHAGGGGGGDGGDMNIEAKVNRLEDRVAAGFEKINDKFDYSDKLIASGFERINDKLDHADKQTSARFEMIANHYTTKADLGNARLSMIRWFIGTCLAMAVLIIAALQLLK